MLGPKEIIEWNELQSVLEGVSSTQTEDEIIWGLSSSKLFTTTSLYRFLTTGGLMVRWPAEFGSAKSH
jgi:hypothetical protein